MYRFILCVVPALLAGSALGQSNCRLYLASQYDWETKKGFYLDLEGSRLAELPLILGVADGEQWRFVSHSPGFSIGRDYALRAVIEPAFAHLFIDGAEVGRMEAAITPHAGALEVNYRPPWADERGDWLAVAGHVRVAVTRDGEEAESRDFDFTTAASRDIPLQLFEPGTPSGTPLDYRSDDTLTIEIDLRFADNDLRAYAPFVDTYGQSIHGDWPEKVTSDEELQADIAAEDAELATMPPSEDFDPYGGHKGAGWTEQATGFYRVTRREGLWWLITPDGNPCFYTGVSSVPALVWETTPVSEREFLFQWLPEREGRFAPAWAANHWGTHDGTEYVCFYTCNLIRKYGEGWDRTATERAFRRLKCFGFSGGGKWGAPSGMVENPVLRRGSTPALVERPDVFDPEVCRTFREELARQIAPRLNDPLVLGWSYGNEYGEIVKPREIQDILAMGADVPCKRAFCDEALKSLYEGDLTRLAAAWKLQATAIQDLYAGTPDPPAEDVEKLRQFYEDAYYSFLYTTIKDIDPNHLYLGNWIVPGWWVNEEDWRIHARHCDVIGYDRYNREYLEERLQRLQRESDKPTLCGEFGLPAWYEGRRGFGRYPANAADDSEAGELYEGWVRGAAADPYCIGLEWFLYRDQPVTGRGPGRGPELVHGEHFAFGIVTETDRVKWPLVQRMREANLQAAIWRQEAARKP